MGLLDPPALTPAAGFQGLLRRRDPMAGFRPVAGRMSWLNSLSNGTDTTVSYRIWHPIAEACSDIRLCYGNFLSNTTDGLQKDGTGTITVKASIELTASGGPASTINDTVGSISWGLLPVYFGASGRSVSIAPGGQVWSDPVPAQFFDITPGVTGFYERVVVTVAAGGKWPRGRHCDNGLSSTYFEAACIGYDIVDSTTALYASGSQRWEPASQVPMYCAVNIVGRPARGAAKRTVALIGDSIMCGTATSVDYSDLRTGGFGQRAFLGKAGVVHVACGGERALDWSKSIYQKPVGWAASRRLGIAGYCTDVLTDYVSNDVYDAGATFASVTLNLQNLWRLLHMRGLDVHITTCTPRTTSTDSWATTANQTVNAAEPLRLQINAWIRAGCPQDPSTGLAVTPGTSGAVLNPYVVTISDTADAVETARDSGLWKVNGTANYYTGDGTHPTAVASAAMAASVPATTILARPLTTT